jgi:hypothetical protein
MTESDVFIDFFWFFRQKIRYSPSNSGLSSYEKRELMGLVQRLHEEDRLIGIQQGMTRIFIHILEKRFGPLSETIRRKIETSDAKTLLTWADRLLIAESIDVIFD